MRRLPTVLAVLCILAASTDLHGQTGAGLGIRVADARGELQDRVEDQGIGVVATSVVTGQSVWLSLTTGWTRFPGLPELAEEGEDPDDEEFYEVMLGWGIRVGPLRAGVRAGRFFGDGASWGYMPVAGIGVGPLLFAAEWDLRQPNEWFAVTGSFLR
ncbi:MAG: hypothetical protein RJQ04_21880 [Longimicrobiales bacterium]